MICHLKALFLGNTMVVEFLIFTVLRGHFRLMQVWQSSKLNISQYLWQIFLKIAHRIAHQLPLYVLKNWRNDFS